MSNNGVKVEVLDNGLTVIGEEISGVEGVSLILLSKTGSRNEIPELSGVSHFLEHMVFKGTESFSALEQTLAFGNIGAQVNAYTSDEQTVYYGTVVSDHFAKLHQLLFEMMRPTLSEEDFNMEKNVILEEIALYEDRPNHTLYESAIQDYYKSSPLGNSVLGTTQSVTDITREGMIGYHEERYDSKNLIVAAAGKFSWDELLTRSRDVSSKWKTLESNLEHSKNNSESNEPARSQFKNFTHHKSVQSQVLILSDAPSATSSLRYASLIASTIIGGPHNSRLYWKLVDTGLAEYAGIHHEEKDGAGYFMISAATTPENEKEVIELLSKELTEGEAITERELEVAKIKVRSRMVMDHELSLGRAMAHALNMQYRKEPFSMKEELENVETVTLDDIQELFTKFPLKDFSQYVMRPEE